MSNERVLDLDDPRSANLRLAGAKASWLARARHQGLSVLPGVVVTADASAPALKLGSDTLRRRGSGGARLVVGQSPLETHFLGEVMEATSSLGTSLAVRSSSVLEGDGEWSGAFASYVDVSPSEMEKAIAGCWASAFTVATLQRFEAVGLEPGLAPMAVLIQPSIQPGFGGVARMGASEDVEVIAIKGSPAPLVQGWEPGFGASVAPSGEISDGDEAQAILGSGFIIDVAQQLRAANRLIGANMCEWAVEDGRLFLLQVAYRSPVKASPARKSRLVDTRLIPLARLARRYPGQLGESLVLAWAVANPGLTIAQVRPIQLGTTAATDDPVNALEKAATLAASLTAETWRMPTPIAAARAAAVLRQVRGTRPGGALDCLAALRPPDPEQGAEILALLQVAQLSSPQWTWHLPVDELQAVLRNDPGASQSPTRVAKRLGVDRWEPFQSAVVESFGKEHVGTPASPGMGSGRLCFIGHPNDLDGFHARDVVVTPQPLPNLAPLLWDAAGLVTLSGSPAAHLFESARSLNVPAVCGVELSASVGADLAIATGQFALAVDGDSGRVYVSEW